MAPAEVEKNHRLDILDRCSCCSRQLSVILIFIDRREHMEEQRILKRNDKVSVKNSNIHSRNRTMRRRLCILILPFAHNYNSLRL